MQAVYRWLWTLVAGNPMVVRIVQNGSRRQRHLWVRMGYLGALIALILFGLLTGGGWGQQVSMTDLAKAGTTVFAIVAYGQVILVCLLAPLFMAGAISQEQQGKTYEILLTTPLSNIQIVLGSLVGRLFFVLALLLSGVPLFAVLLVFGGVPMSSVFISFAVAALTALTVGAVAVTMSVLRAGGRKAVFTFVIVIAAYLVAAYALDAALLRRLPGAAGGMGMTTWLTPLHPLLVLEASLNRANYQPPGPEHLAAYPALIAWYLGRPFAVFATLSLLSSGALTLCSALALRRIGQGDPAWLIWLRKKLGLPVGGGERRRDPREVWHNPIAWREANTRGRVLSGILARWGFATLAVIAGFVLIALHHFDGLPTVPGPGGQPQASAEVLRSGVLALLLLEVAVVTLVALYMSAGCVSREREDGTLDLFLTTPLTPKQYIWGKLRGLVSFLSLLIAAPVLTLALVGGYAVLGWSLGWETATYAYRGLSSGGAQLRRDVFLVLPESALLLLLTLVPFVALCVMTGMSWSLKSKGVLGAVVPSVGIIGVLVLVLGLCGWNAAENIPLIGPVLNAFSPVTNVTMLVDPWHRVSGFAESPGVGRTSLVIAALCAAGGYSLIVYAMLLSMVKGFDQTVRRLSGG